MGWLAATINQSTNLFNYASHTQQKLISSRGVGKDRVTTKNRRLTLRLRLPLHGTGQKSPCNSVFCTHETTISVGKFRRLAVQDSLLTERKYRTVRCERSGRSIFSAGRK